MEKERREYKEAIRKTKVAPWYIYYSYFDRWKDTSQDEATKINEEIRPVTSAINFLSYAYARLKESDSQSLR